ncbi:hypothetical protein [Micromonospora sp. LOL_023]|uniref:hypothetical protein n=1 Tax=Micromonospora sp. LOL_023 TaxID=3345418 RepID=UPI003A8A8A07
MTSELTGEPDTSPRTQLVLTVANLDTGAVASADVRPGDIAPEPAPYGGWRIGLRPLRDELAAQVKADRSTLHDLRFPDGEPDSDRGLWLTMPPNWHPGLPAADRAAGVAAAHTTGVTYSAWLIHLGRTVAVPPASADDLLSRLCGLADLLCLDLVVEARWGVFPAGLNWDIRFETPGAAVPRGQHGYADSLPAACRRTSIMDAFDGLGERSLTAPAYFLRPGQRSTLPPEEVDADQLERRIIRDCGVEPPVSGGPARGPQVEATAGAQAIWRDRRWRHTSLRRIIGPRPAIPERAPLLRRAWQPSLPAWLGEPIPSVACPDCHGTGWRHPVLTCRRCGGHGRRFFGAVVTVTDLRERVTHVEWRPSRSSSGDGGAAGGNGQAGAAGGGELAGAVVARWQDQRLPERFRVARLAGMFGVRPVDLLDLTEEQVVSLSLRDGIAMTAGDNSDPIRRYVTGAAAGRPGARLLVHATDWAELPTFDSFAALVVGLGLALRVTARDLPRRVDQPTVTYGLLWSVEAVPPTTAVDESVPVDEPLGRSVQQAVADCLRYLELPVVESVPADPAQPVPVPQQLVPPTVPDIVGRLTELAAIHIGQVVAAHLDHAGCRFWLSPS